MSDLSELQERRTRLLHEFGKAPRHGDDRLMLRKQLHNVSKEIAAAKLGDPSIVQLTAQQIGERAGRR